MVNERSYKTKGQIDMKTTEQQHNERRHELMEKCFECYAEK